MALWSSSAAVVAITDALNRAYDIEEGRPWWKVRLIAIGLTLSLAAFVLVAFAPEATAAQIEAFLTRSRAVIVDGPRPGGLFRLHVGDRRLPPEELDRLATELRGQPVIRLVVPAR
jgi:hypothetical protein